MRRAGREDGPVAGQEVPEAVGPVSNVTAVVLRRGNPEISMPCGRRDGAGRGPGSTMAAVAAEKRPLLYFCGFAGRFSAAIGAAPACRLRQFPGCRVLNSVAAGRRLARRTVLLQAVAVAITAAACLTFGGPAALAALVGGAAMTLGTALAAWGGVPGSRGRGGHGIRSPAPRSGGEMDRGGRGPVARDRRVEAAGGAGARRSGRGRGRRAVRREVRPALALSAADRADRVTPSSRRFPRRYQWQ